MRKVTRNVGTVASAGGALSVEASEGRVKVTRSGAMLSPELARALGRLLVAAADAAEERKDGE